MERTGELATIDSGVIRTEDLRHASSCKRPSVSIVVPVFNGESELSRCLHSLQRQTYPSACFEIIVVDDGSTDSSASSAQRIAECSDIRVRVLRKANGGPASARNAGIRSSQAAIVAFMDVDCAAEPEWLDQLVAVLTASRAAGVGGAIINLVPAGWVADYLTSGNFFRHRVRRGAVDYLLTANVAYRRSALLDVGGFAEIAGAWGEDADLSFRLKQAGHLLVTARRGLVTHFGTPASLRSLIRELYRYGRGNAMLSRNWTNGRTPASEFMRHGLAVELALWLALSRMRAPGITVWRALSFWPLVVIEHTAFLVGMMHGLLWHRGSTSK